METADKKDYIFDFNPFLSYCFNEIWFIVWTQTEEMHPVITKDFPNC